MKYAIVTVEWCLGKGHSSQELNTILNGEEWTEKSQVLV